MAQLGNKIEHGLHAYTPAEQRVVKAAAESFRVNPEFDTEELLLSLGTGEAVVSTLDEKGAPSMAQHAFVLPPESRMGALEDAERAEIVKNSVLNSKYETMIDSVSAYEVITGKTPAAPAVSAGGGYTYSADFNTPADAAYSGQTASPTRGMTEPEPADQDTAPEPDNGEISFDVEMEVARQHEALNSRYPEEEARSTKKSSKAAKADVIEEESTGRSIGDMADSFLGKSGTRQVMRSTGGSIGREIGKTIGEAVLGKKGRTIGGNIGSAIGRNLFGTLTKKR
jgi:hypothetical protein